MLLNRMRFCMKDSRARTGKWIKSKRRREFLSRGNPAEYFALDKKSDTPRIRASDFLIPVLAKMRDEWASFVRYVDK